MSRASRKIRRKQQQQKQVENMQEIISLKEKIRKLYQEEDYAEVINTLAALVQDGSHDTDDLYLGAQSYFMLGDYMRAARMVETIWSSHRGISMPASCSPASACSRIARMMAWPFSISFWSIMRHR